ncbi:MAG TPA: HlyD family efflux transporter periplasmic adaptor subunit [Bryobacteraceae bacterium]|nr:HlyD family efflux transporter periplasmic adaptor subunit [Bryobacteraceae bacterium]
MKIGLRITQPRVIIRTVVGLSFLLVVAVVIYSFIPRASASAHMNAVPPPVQPARAVAVASPGRVEGLSDIVSVGAAIDGVIQKIYVKEGQLVKQGEILAEIECNDLRTGLKVAEAEAESLTQARARLLHGSRIEERQSAAQKTAAAHAVVEQASSQLARMSTLYAAEEVSRQAYDEAQRDRDVAEAQFQQAKRNEELVNAGPLSEDVARADADVAAAQDRVKLAQDRLNKCVVRAPISGTVLRVHLREGESFALLAPHPLFSMADISGRRVRAEVDEIDVGRVYIGQKVVVSSDAYSRRSFTGTVARVASIMGRKSVRTGDPAQKDDRDVLEVTANLDPTANALPVGLRVTVQFIHADGNQ